MLMLSACDSITAGRVWLWDHLYVQIEKMVTTLFGIHMRFSMHTNAATNSMDNHQPSTRLVFLRDRYARIRT
jgi:hypothetical protein